MGLKNHYKMKSPFGRITSELLSWSPKLGDRETRRLDVSARVITVANYKGGVGKTTTAVNLASGLAFLKNYRVLLIDFDPQGNASISLDVDIETLRYSVKDLLSGKMTNWKYLLWPKGEKLDILPANATLRDIEPELMVDVNGRIRLKERLAPIRDRYDFIIIDTPPTVGLFLQAPLIAATEVIAPIDVGYFSLQGIRQLLEEINKVRSHLNPDLQIGGILLTKYDSRTSLSKQVEGVLRKGFKEQAFKTMIRVNVDVIRAQAERKSIFAYDLASTGAADYKDLIEEIVGNVVIFPKRREKIGDKEPAYARDTRAN
jgi:chromosome partitioning protein